MYLADCLGCICMKCKFTMPQGDATDCHNCDLCIEGDLKQLEGKCNEFEE